MRFKWQARWRTWNTHLDQEEEADVSRMTALERDVARPIRLVLFSAADKRYTLCNMTDDGWLNVDGLNVRVASALAWWRAER